MQTHCVGKAYRSGALRDPRAIGTASTAACQPAPRSLRAPPKSSRAWKSIKEYFKRKNVGDSIEKHSYFLAARSRYIKNIQKNPEKARLHCRGDLDRKTVIDAVDQSGMRQEDVHR